MTHPVRNRIAIILVATVMLVSFAIEEAGAERRRRKQKCNSRAVIEVAVDVYNYQKSQQFMKKSYRQDRDGCCSGHLPNCRYTGPNQKALFNEWKRRNPADVNSLVKFLKIYTPHTGKSRALVFITYHCGGKQIRSHQGRLSSSGGKLLSNL